LWLFTTSSNPEMKFFGDLIHLSHFWLLKVISPLMGNDKLSFILLSQASGCRNAEWEGVWLALPLLFSTFFWKLS
jgi:hypothetical protein